ncbi:MAG: hypothetical protein IPK72_15615 [Candidatus Eisenbacteria bacterium]|nr:hypothetical protein [Candidatus Eisenbacteria bacterium]
MLAKESTAAAPPRERLSAWSRFLRRRRFIVDPGLQFQLLAVSFGQVLFFGTVLSIGLFLPLVIQLLSGPLTSPATVRAADYFLNLHNTFWASSVLALVAILLHGVMVSHRIAGPLHRMRRVMRSLREGRIPTPIHLRAGDFLQADVDEVNLVLAELEARRLSDLTLAGSLENAIDRLGAARTQTGDPALLAAIDALTARRAELRRALTALTREVEE